MSIALYVLVEGDTEERFANRVLVPHLVGRGVCAYVSRIITRGRRGGTKTQGGGRTYRAWKKDLETWIKQEGRRVDVWFTTMLDLYGLASFSDGFPGYLGQANCRDPYSKVCNLEQAWTQDIGFERFIPHLQLHEFEALLFADITQLKLEFIEHARQVDLLAAEIAMAGKPAEEINEGLDTAPSKRIIRSLPQYASRKADAGSSTAGAIGLARLREACPHFGKWLGRLETLGNLESQTTKGLGNS